MNKAELLICSHQFDSALLYYDTAFSNTTSPFAVDVNNAFSCAIIRNDYKTAKKYGKVLINKGCPLSFFTKRSFNKKFIDSDEFKELETDYYNLNQAYEKRIDQNLIAELDFMINRDQAYRGVNENIDQMLKVDNENKVKLNTIINQYGYPSEDKIGITIIQDTIIGFPTINVVFRHYFQNGNQALKDTLFHFVKTGELCADHLASWLGTRPNYPIGASVLGLVKDTLYQYQYFGIKEKIEKNRKDLLLEPHADYAKKTIFEYCDDFRNDFFITSIIIPNSIEHHKLSPKWFKRIFKKIGTCHQIKQ